MRKSENPKTARQRIAGPPWGHQWAGPRSEVRGIRVHKFEDREPYPPSEEYWVN